jgi:hypothetical protein
MLAAFVTPALAWVGAGAIAAPILIHLLARRRFKRIRWAAMDFLIDAERRNRRRIRMEEWILLALRCLAVALLGLMVARPFMTPSGLASAWGGSRRTERIFVLDDSFSMGYQSPGATPFERAKSAVRRLIDSIRKDTPDDTVTVLRMSDPSKPVESGASLDSEGAEELLARLEALSPSQRSIDLSAVFEGVVEALQRDPGVVNVAVYLISDFQRTDWVRREGASDAAASLESRSSEAGVAASLADWASKQRGLRLVLLNVGETDAANTAVTDLTLQGGQLVAGTTGMVRASVTNFSSRTVENLELQTSVGNKSQSPKTIQSLAEHQSAVVDLEVDFPRAGDESVRVEIPRDALPLDNVRYVASEVVSAVRILLVNGEPSADEYDDEVALLTTALRPEGEVFSGHEVVVADEPGLADANLAGFHVVVLANVYRISEPTIESLERFVRQGGGVVFFLGDQIDADLYNSTLFRGGEGLLPAELGELVRPADPAHLVITDRLHPALRAVGREDDPLGISQIPFFEFFSCKPLETPADAAQGASNKKIESAPAAQPVRVIARFDTPDEHPAILERAFGRGRVLLVTTSADKEWNQWPDHPTYLPVITELIRHTARRAEGDAEQWVGAPLELPVDPALFGADALVRSPAYPNEPEASVTASPSADGRGLTIQWEHTEMAGLYQFVLRRLDGSEAIRLSAVNVDPRESDLTMALETELRRALGGLPFEYVQGLERVAQAADEARVELWRPVLIFAALVLMSEQCLAWWWGRRR